MRSLVLVTIMTAGCTRSLEPTVERPPPLKRIGAGLGDLPTIVCDGKGGYRPDLRKGALFPCLIPRCFTAHEMSHVADWKKQCPKGCEGKPDGAAAPRDGKTCPKWKEDAKYDEFLSDSECRAYKTDLKCLADLLALVERSGPKAAFCKDWIKFEIKRSRRGKKKHCRDESSARDPGPGDRGGATPLPADGGWGEEQPFETEEGDDEEPSCAVPEEGGREADS